MKLKFIDEYFVYTEPDNNMHYYKNGKYHREAGPALVLNHDIEEYSNLIDKDLYKHIDQPMPAPWNKNIYRKPVRMIVKHFMPCSKYYLNGDEYSLEEFQAIILKKELDTQLHTNESNSKRIKI